jgi:transcriptional regulator with XRE-family HTH domain
MTEKLQRVFRDRNLTDEEVSADQEVRARIQAEFPPRHLTSTSQPSQLSELIRHSIRGCSKSIEELAQESGISPVLLARFVSGESDIHLATADRLAGVLGLEVTSG